MSIYVDENALYVYNKMCNFHREKNLQHSCRNAVACARAGTLAAWLEGLIELDEFSLKYMLNWVVCKPGDQWRDVENRIRVSLCNDLRGME
jgi:hypothetical protein